ncbi:MULTISPECIES: succinate dehydrogenase [Metallosphaera]|uniref:succinate dehydrogenase n=1 Tax=Metallosphaera TaxID=41980 RepID=UPI001F0540A9|nr:succinate dehydrogenase [Metallosphaera sedula]MCH1772168.1 succinate dehydrogenase [Metallosphaera sedula]MCP6727714.1 succinate dehydrogenase [Metallosphaera sedula]
MRESTIRMLTYGTGILVLALVTVHLLILSPGGLSRNVSYGVVVRELENVGYSTALVLLLFFTLVHSGLGLRRALIDSGNGGRVKAIMGVIVVIFTIVLALGILTVIG